MGEGAFHILAGLTPTRLSGGGFCHGEGHRVGAGAAWSGVGALVAARRACWVDDHGCASSATGGHKGPNPASAPLPPLREVVSPLSNKPTRESPHKGRSSWSPYILTHTARYHSKTYITDAHAKTSQSLPARFRSGETLPLQLYPLPVLDVGHQQ